MRLGSLVIGLALVGATALFFYLQPAWLWNSVRGYSAAGTPGEAMDQFRKAVRDRDYKAAALYCAGEYGDQLARLADDGAAVSAGIERLRNIMDEKGLVTANARSMLYYLDPFPPQFKVKDVKEKGAGAAVGYFELEESAPAYPALASGDGVDPRWFRNALHPGRALYTVELKNEGGWKLNFALVADRRDAMTYFRDRAKSLLNALDRLRDEARRGQYLKEQFEPELKRVLKASQ
jgi:hypothetical protein